MPLCFDALMLVTGFGSVIEIASKVNAVAEQRCELSHQSVSAHVQNAPVLFPKEPTFTSDMQQNQTRLCPNWERGISINLTGTEKPLLWFIAEAYL